jgi:hypothetical protein
MEAEYSAETLIAFYQNGHCPRKFLIRKLVVAYLVKDLLKSMWQWSWPNLMPDRRICLETLELIKLRRKISGRRSNSGPPRQGAGVLSKDDRPRVCAALDTGSREGTGCSSLMSRATTQTFRNKDLTVPGGP